MTPRARIEIEAAPLRHPRRRSGMLLCAAAAVVALVALSVRDAPGAATQAGEAPTAGAPLAAAAPPEGALAVAASPAISVFPVQGRCTFIDTYGQARGGGRTHQGVDIIAPEGRPVYAAVSGTLTRRTLAGAGSLSGNAWYLERTDGTYYFYAHLSAFAAGLEVGSQVAAGTVIAYVGATGNAGIPHLHFEVHPGGGAAINPTPIVAAVNACGSPDPPPGAASGPPVPTTTTTIPPGVASAHEPAVRITGDP